MRQLFPTASRKGLRVIFYKGSAGCQTPQVPLKLPESSMENSGTPQLDALDDIRALVHDLSNSLEIILQAAYLLAESELEAKDKRWAEMIDTAARDAAQINHKLLEILRSQTEMPARGSR